LASSRLGNTKEPTSLPPSGVGSFVVFGSECLICSSLFERPLPADGERVRRPPSPLGPTRPQPSAKVLTSTTHGRTMNVSSRRPLGPRGQTPSQTRPRLRPGVLSYSSLRRFWNPKGQTPSQVSFGFAANLSAASPPRRRRPRRRRPRLRRRRRPFPSRPPRPRDPVSEFLAHLRVLGTYPRCA